MECMYGWMYVWMDGCMSVCLSVWMYDYVCMHACMHVFQMLCDESSLDSSSSSASGIACLSSSSSRRAPEQDISEELHTHTPKYTCGIKIGCSLPKSTALWLVIKHMLDPVLATGKWYGIG